MSFTTRRRLIRGTLLVLAGGLAAGLLVTLYCVPPTPNSFYPGCPFHTMTGLHCPGCGTTRALYSALHGQWSQAVRFNALSFVVLPLVAFSLFRSLWVWMWELPARGAGRWTNRIIWGLGVLLLVFWVVRNIPAYPFTLLAPPALSVSGP